MEKQEGEMEIGGTATVQSASSVIGGHDPISFGLSNNDTNLTKAKGIEIKDSEAISKKNGIYELQLTLTLDLSRGMLRAFFTYKALLIIL